MAEQQPSGTRAVAAPPSTGDNSLVYWALPRNDVLHALGTAPEGLYGPGEAEARLRRARTLAPHHHRTQLVLLLRQFANPITLILIFATLLSAVLGEATDAAIILAIVLLSGLLSFWQEYGASRAVEDLLATVQVTVEVLRDAAAHVRPRARYRARRRGRRSTPATSFLATAASWSRSELLVDEAPLTGESFPVEKAPADAAGRNTAAPARTTASSRAPTSSRGTATASSSIPGGDTEFGQIAEQLEPAAARDPLRARAGASSGDCCCGSCSCWSSLIFAATCSSRGRCIDSLLFSVALAVGPDPAAPAGDRQRQPVARCPPDGARARSSSSA